jgi:hypothetical protein
MYCRYGNINLWHSRDSEKRTAIKILTGGNDNYPINNLETIELFGEKLQSYFLASMQVFLGGSRDEYQDLGNARQVLHDLAIHPVNLLGKSFKYHFKNQKALSFYVYPF